MSDNNVSIMKQIGGVSIIAGTAIGAGMLGIPYAIAAVGFSWAIILLTVVWLVMYLASLFIIEINISQPLGSDMDSMAYNLLGKWGKIFNVTFYFLLLYSLLTAYIFLGGKLFNSYILAPFNLNIDNFGKILFCLIFGFCLFQGTKVVFYTNKIFLSLKVIIFLVFVIFTIPKVKMNYLSQASMGSEYIWFAIPILVTSFGFHVVIPSIRNYYNNDKVFKRVVKIGATTPLIVYVIWAFVTLGAISLHGNNGFIDLITNHKSLAFGYTNSGGFIVLLIKLFENFAIITSFLGVGLSLYSFNKDFYKIKSDKALSRLYIAGVTLIPPFLFAIYFVKSFISALGYASIFVALLLAIQPVLMIWSLQKLEKSARCIKKDISLLFVFIFGIAVIVLQLLASSGILVHI